MKKCILSVLVLLLTNLCFPVMAQQSFSQPIPVMSSTITTNEFKESFEREGAEITYGVTLATATVIPYKAVRAWAHDILALMNDKFGKKYADKKVSPYSPRVQREFAKEVREISQKYFKENEIKEVIVAETSFSAISLGASNRDASKKFLFWGKPGDSTPPPVFKVQ